MKTEELLEIIIPTFNRQEVLAETLPAILSSPVGRCRITVLDNNSSDATSEYIQGLLPSYPNLHYIKNRFNLGLAGNFCKAFTIPSKKYFWVISDDAQLDFTHWDALEQALREDYQVLLTLNYYQVTRAENTDEKAHIILMLIWMFSGIFKTSLLSDEIMLNALTDIYTVHPQIALILKAIGEGRKIFIPPFPIASPSANIEEKKKKYSFNRCEKAAHFRLDKPANFFPGFLNAMENIQNPKLKKRCIELIFKYRFLKFNRKYFYYNRYCPVNFADTFILLPFKYKCRFLWALLAYLILYAWRKHEQ